MSPKKEPRAPQACSPNPPLESDSKTGRRILLVEDEALILMSTMDNLEEMGFQVETAATASEALSKITALEGKVVAAVVDIGLPDRPGDVLVKEIRGLFPSVPIVIASGHGREHVRAKFPGEEGIAVLTKPYLEAGLKAALAEIGVETT